MYDIKLASVKSEPCGVPIILERKSGLCNVYRPALDESMEKKGCVCPAFAGR